MFCVNCGGQIENAARFCPHCGAAATPVAQNQPAQPIIPTPQKATQTTLETPAQKMGWFKFLINFALWASAVMNIANAGQLMTGGHYDGYADLVYSYYGGLQALDMIVGLASVVMAVFAIVTRFRLARYRKNGPAMLTLVYAGNIAVSLIYIIGASAIVGGDLDISSSIVSLITSAVVMCCNIAYFKKRAHLFVN